MNIDSDIDIQSEELIGIFKLYPVIVPGWTTPIKPAERAHGGVPRRLFTGEPARLLCVVDPWTVLQSRGVQNLAAFDSVELFVNGEPTPVDSHTVLPGTETHRIALYVPQSSCVNGVNAFQYVVKRPSSNEEKSDVLRVLYHLRAHANINLVITPDVSKGVTAELAAQGVTFEMRYNTKEPFDRVQLRLGNATFPFDVTDPSAPVRVTLYTADFKDVGDGTVQVNFVVTDQLGNLGASANETLEIRLTQEEALRAPVLVPPANPIVIPAPPDVVIVRFEHTTANEGDEVHLVALNALPGTPPFAPLKLNRNKRANFRLDVPLLTAHQGRTLRVQCTLNSNDQVRTSPVLRVLIPAPQLDLNFRNAPYSAVVDGSINDVTLELLKNGSPQPGVEIKVDLPAGFTYADGGTGSRTFMTDSLGIANVGMLRAPSLIDSYELTASSAEQTATAVVEVEEPGVVDWIQLNSPPFDIAMTPDAKHLYAPLPYLNTVAVIDIQRLQVIKNIPVEIRPHTISISPDGKRAYTTNRNSNVYEIDTDQQVVIGKLSVGSELAFVTSVSPDSSRLFVSTWEWGYVHVFNTATATKISTIRITESPSWLTFSPDARLLYVAVNSYNGTTARLDVFDAASLGAVKRIGLPTGSNPCSVAVTVDGRYAYVVLWFSGQVAVVDTALMSVSKYINVGRKPYAIAMDRKGTFAYVTNFESSSVSVIDLSRQEVVRTIPLGGGTAYGIALSADGSRAFVSNTSNSRIAVLRIG